MRVCNTKYMIDKNRPLVQDLYEERVGMQLIDLTPQDIDRGEVMRALAELRLYRLPPYFDVPTKVKGRIQNAGCLLHDSESPITSAAIERELINEGSGIFAGIAPHRECPQCHKVGKIIDTGLCVDCMMNAIPDVEFEELRRWDQDEPWLPLAASTTTMSQFKQEYKKSLRPALSLPYTPWTTPKKTLLAAEIGCTMCSTRHKVKWLWSDDLSDWGDGVCPQCTSEGLWSTAQLSAHGPRWYRRATPRATYDKCTVCKSSFTDYALWGMCHECYANWQTSYYDRPEFLAFKYGALACLLVWPSNEWVKHLRSRLPGNYVRKTNHTSNLEEFIPRTPKVRKKNIPKTIAEAGVDIDSYLRRK